MAPDRTFQQATTDSSGRFAIHFAAGTGDYLIHVSALGYKAVRKRLTRAPGDTSLDESDSLLVSRDQSDSLKKEQTRYRAHVDSTWRAALAPLVAMGDDYDANVAMNIIDDATEKAWLAARDEMPVLERILSPLQMRLAPFPIPYLVQAKGKPTVGIRMMTF